MRYTLETVRTYFLSVRPKGWNVIVKAEISVHIAMFSSARCAILVILQIRFVYFWIILRNCILRFLTAFERLKVFVNLKFKTNISVVYLESLDFPFNNQLGSVISIKPKPTSGVLHRKKLFTGYQSKLKMQNFCLTCKCKTFWNLFKNIIQQTYEKYRQYFEFLGHETVFSWRIVGILYTITFPVLVLIQKTNNNKI